MNLETFNVVFLVENFVFLFFEKRNCIFKTLIKYFYFIFTITFENKCFFWYVGVVANEKAGPAVVLSFLFAAFSSLLSALCYSEFAASEKIVFVLFRIKNKFCRIKTFQECRCPVPLTRFLMFRWENWLDGLSDGI